MRNLAVSERAFPFVMCLPKRSEAPFRHGLGTKQDKAAPRQPLPASLRPRCYLHCLNFYRIGHNYNAKYKFQVMEWVRGILEDRRGWTRNSCEL